MTFDPKTASLGELREHVQRLQQDRERTTAGFHEVEVDAYAACTDPMCEGAQQQPVRAIRETQVLRFGDVDGDWQGPFANTISHSHTRLRFVVAADAPCPVCKVVVQRDLTEQERKPYPNIMGAQDALLRVRKAGLSGPVDAPGALAAAGAAKASPPTAREALDMRFVNGKIEEAEYVRKLEILGEPVPDALKPAVS